MKVLPIINNVLLLINFVFLIYFIWISKKKKPKGRILTTFIFDNQIKIKGGNLMFSIKDNQKIKGKLNFVDAKGNPAKVEAGSVKVVSSDPDVATVTQNPDDESEFEAAGGKTGVVTLNYSADADLGEGVVTITGSDNGEVLAGNATNIGASFSDPVDQ